MIDVDKEILSKIFFINNIHVMLMRSLTWAFSGVALNESHSRRVGVRQGGSSVSAPVPEKEAHEAGPRQIGAAFVVTRF